MIEFLEYMFLPNVAALVFIWMMWIRPLRLREKALRLFPFILALSIIAYVGGEAGVCALKPWFFDCSKTLGICVCGLPIEDALVSLFITMDVAFATLAFSEIGKRSKGTIEFLQYAFFIKRLP